MTVRSPQCGFYVCLPISWSKKYRFPHPGRYERRLFLPRTIFENFNVTKRNQRKEENWKWHSEKKPKNPRKKSKSGIWNRKKIPRALPMEPAAAIALLILRLRNSALVRFRGAVLNFLPDFRYSHPTFWSKKYRPPHLSRHERRLFPPEQFSKASSVLNELSANRNKFRLLLESGDCHSFSILWSVDKINRW